MWRRSLSAVFWASVDLALWPMLWELGPTRRPQHRREQGEFKAVEGKIESGVEERKGWHRHLVGNFS